MSRLSSRIEAHMTKAPHSIGAEQPLTRARAMMVTNGVRHLPVLHGGKLVGILSDRDIRVIESIDGADLSCMTVSDAMSEDVYCVPPETPLDEVVREMATHKYGSTVVASGGRIIGIFTTVDVCRSLANLLRERSNVGPTV